MQSMPTTFNPVFVIALGGTGTSVARMLRERLEWRYGDVSRLPFVQFLFIDTDHNNPDASGPDGILINPHPDQVSRMMTNPEEFEHIGLKSWVDMDALKRADKGGFQQGAQGVRMFGRIAFLASQSFQQMWNQVANKASEVSTVTDAQIKTQLGIDPDSEVRVGPARVYVISSSCGGTGAGVFIDVGYMVHEILRNEGVQAERMGILAIARQDATSERQYTRNTAALLSELDYYNRSGVVYEAKYAQQVPVRTRAACYDYCYLVSPSGPRGEIGFSDFLRRISEYVYVDVIAQTQEAQSRRVDFGPDMAEYDLDGYPLRFLTFGVSSIEFPADVCHQACYHRTVSEFIESWLHVAADRVHSIGAQPQEPSDRDVHDLLNLVGVGANRAADDGLLLQLTEVPEDLRDVAGGIRPQDWMNEQIRRTFADEFSDESFQELEQKLDEALRPEGYFTKCVEYNTKRLRNTRWLEQAVVDWLMPRVFRLDQGPRYALGLVRALRQALTAELKRIDTELAATKVPGYTLDDARQAIKAVRGDWLLRIPPIYGFRWLNEHAARREMLKPRVMVCETYNRAAEAILLAAKRDLYNELARPVLTALDARLIHLLEYLGKWHDEATGAYAAIMARPLDRRTAMLFSEQVVDLKMDRVMKDPDDGTRDKFLRGLLEATRVQEFDAAFRAPLDNDDSRPFTSTCPTDAARGGLVQMRYVNAICEHIRDCYRRRAPAGTSPIIYDERVIERFQEAAVKSTGLSAEINQVVDEGMELAELQLQHPKYSDIDAINPRDGWWCFFNGAQDAHAWPEFKAALTDAVSAAAGRTGYTSPGPDKWLQEVQDSYMVILLRERAAYPTRIIRGYDIDEREEKIQGVRAVAGRVQEITAFARTGVRPRPPGERDIREAEQFFVGAILLGMLSYSQERQEFSMELAQAPGMPRRLLTLPTDFGVSVGELAYRNETRTILAQMIQDRINEMGNPEALRLTTAVKGRIEITDTGEARTNEMARLGLRDLDDARAANIIRGFEDHFDLISDEQSAMERHPYADHVLDPPMGRRPGYYCRNRSCGIFLGPEVQSIPPSCPNCNLSFVPYTD